MNSSKRKWLGIVCAAAVAVQTVCWPIGGTAAAAGAPAVTEGTESIPPAPIAQLTGGKARYNPGEQASFELDFDESASWSGTLVLEFYSVNKLAGSLEREISVLEGTDSALTVTWQPPAADFRGYLVKAYVKERPGSFKTAAVDVSSDWTHFPRYGYTTEFPQETAEESDAKLKELSQEYYLNAYQFYDWMWRHDVSVVSKTDENGEPLLDENGDFITEEITPDTVYKDLLGRPLYPAAVKQQVEAAQKYGSAAMAYQMNYAARENYEKFGVKREWGLYNKNAQFPNPDPLMYQNGFFFDWVPSALYLQDPGNPEWQAYITREFNRSVNEFGFDGIHLDQWGASDNDFLYDYFGNERYYSLNYDELINATKSALTANNAAKDDVTFNMVGGNGGYSHVPSPSTMTDFDYSEIWTDKDNYRDLLQVIQDTKAKNGNKAMVIAAYMNYKQATGDTYLAEELEDVARTVEFQSRINGAYGWVGDFGKKDEDAIVWTVNAPAAGEYELAIGYGHDNGASPAGRLTVNGETLDETLAFSEKTGWGNPNAEVAVQAQLRAGANEIKLQLNTNDLWLNVDSLTVNGAGKTQVYEAEYAELISCKVDQYGNVYYFETEGDYVSFEVEAAADGVYPLQFRHSAAAAAVTRDLFIDGELAAEDVAFAPTGSWNTYKNGPVMNVPLHAGVNTITLKQTGPADAGLKLDYAQVGELRYEAEKARFGWQPTKEALIEKHEGAAAETFVKNIRNAPDSISFDWNAEEAGVEAISFQYATINSPVGELYVNGTKSQNVSLPGTGGWGGDGKWAWATVNVPVRQGANEIRLALASQGQYLNLDGIMTDSGFVTVDQAAVSGGISVADAGLQSSVRTDNHNGAAGKEAAFTLDAPEAGIFKLGVWYRTGTDNANATLTIGDDTYEATLPNNGWYLGDGWGLVELDVQLAAGSNTVVVALDSESAYINLHALSFGKKLEAEDAAIRTNGVVKGAGWLDDFGSAGDSAAWSVTASEAGPAEVAFNYRSDEALDYELIADGSAEVISFGATGGQWTELSHTLSLTEGAHTLMLRPVSNSSQSIELESIAIAESEVIPATALTRGGAAALETVSADIGYAGQFLQKGDYIRFETGAVTSEGRYEITVAYRNPGSLTERALYVNGRKAGSLSFPATGDEWSTAAADVYLNGDAAVNSLLLKMEQAAEAQSIDIDYMALDDVKYEAEAAETGWEPVVAKTGGVETTLGKTDNHGRAGQSITFDIDAASEAEELLFKYRSGNNPAVHIYVDGVQIAQDVVFGATSGGWDGGMAEKSVKTGISPGSHTVQLVMATDGQYINMDSLIVAGTEYEAEDASFGPVNHGITVSQGYVTDFDDENDFLTFNLEAAQAETVNLTWKYRNAAPSGAAAMRTLYVNGVKQASEAAFPHTGALWGETTVSGVALREGANQITLRLENRDDEGIQLDYVDVGGRRLHAEKADFTPSMVLYKDLLLNFGHTGDEITFPITVEQAGETSLIFNYANAGSTSTKTLYIDGQPALDGDGKPVRLAFTPTSNGESFNEDVYYIVPYLSEGEHDVTLKHEADDKGSITLKSMTLGFFDEPSVRLTDAALAAMGATHIEIGTAESLEEGPNMLAHEYYPNRSKKMKNSLRASMKDYYKFFAAYENILFDSRLNEEAAVSVTDSHGQAVATSGGGEAETLLVIARDNEENSGFENYDIVHLVNLLNNDSNWRNAAAEPELQTGLSVRYPLGAAASRLPELKVYSASPDRDGGMFRELNFEWSGTDLLITVPSLEYWEMIVIDKGTSAPADGGGGYVPPVTAETKPNERTASREELAEGSDSVAISLKEGQDTLLIPAEHLSLLGDRPLELSADGVRLTFPAAVLNRAAQAHAPSEQGSLAVIVSPVSGDPEKTLLEAVRNTPAAVSAATASALFDFQLGWTTKTGFIPFEDNFEEAVKLELPIQEGADEELAGLYVYDPVATEWSYIGGTADHGVLHAELPHFSSYAVLTWKRSYTDVDDRHWAARAIEVLGARHIAEGKDDGRFDAEASLTRAELAALLARAYGLQAKNGAAEFRDVNPAAWYAESVAAVHEAGWMIGRSGDSFAPDAAVTREEAAVLLQRIDGESIPEAAAGAYADAADIAHWAAAAVARVTEAGLMQGYPDGTFAPKREITRAQAAQLLYRLLTGK